MQVVDKDYIYPPKPMYVPPTSRVFSDLDNDTRWVAEVKKDGWRMMVRVDPKKKIELWTRHRTIELSKLPGVRNALAALNLPADTILDGELLEHRGTTKDMLMLWGIFKWDGKLLVKTPYKEIIWRMNFIPEGSKHLMLPEFVFEGKKKFYEEVIKKKGENEGIVIKKLDVPVPFFHNRCEKIRSWIKVKPSI